MPLDLIFHVWLGFAFAWCARERVKMDGIWAQPSITILALFAGMILMPTTIYFYLAHPAWSWLYLFDPEKVSRLAVITVVAAKMGAMLGGYWLSVRLLRAGRERIVFYGGAGAFAVLALVALLVRGRIFVAGSYETFRAGRALPLADVKLGYVLVAVTIGLWGSIAYVGLELWRDGRRAASR